MTTEEKAKAYDEALAKAKVHINIKGIGDTVDLCKHLFSELRESEDERIRRFLITIVNNLCAPNFKDVEKKDVLAYLEKQKEQKPMYNLEIPAGDVAPAEEDGPFDEDEFLEGELSAFLQNYDKEYDDDAAISDMAKHFYEIGKKQKEQNKCPEFCSGHCVGCERNEQKEHPTDAKSERVIKAARSVLNNWLDGTDCPDVSGDFTELEYAIREYDGEEKAKEQKPVEGKEYTSPDCGTSACCDDERFEIITQARRDIIEKTNIAENELSMELPLLDGILMRVWQVGWLNKQPAEWSEEDEHRRTDAIYFLESAMKHYADTSEIEKTIDWLKSLPERFNPQPQQEWNEEDEKMSISILNLLCSQIAYVMSNGTTTGKLFPTYVNERDWFKKRLKSLRPQYHGDVTMTEAYKMGLEAGKASSWKPSEEHLSALLAVFNDPDNIGSQTCQLALTDLYEQLKKLI